MNRTLTTATIVVACAGARAAFAQNQPVDFGPTGRAPAAECIRLLDPDAVVRCALAASPEVRVARAQVDAAAGRTTSAAALLPSNPVVSGSVASRRRPAPDPVTVLNWNLTLSQELEIGGQRGARVDAAQAEVTALARRVGVAEQEVAAGALAVYYEAVAAQEAVRFATELVQTSQALAAYAEGRAKEAVLAGVEADVARAEATRIGLVAFEAERRLAQARAALAVLIDVDASRVALPDRLSVPASLELPAGGLEDQALRLRGEVAAAEMERRVLEHRLALVRRERVPNLTLSAFAERGEIDDRILGVGLSVPIPLPAPVGRTRAGEIAETLAQIRAAEASAELVRRRVRVEVARATAALRAREGAAVLFAGDLLKRARADLASVREAISSRQLPLREGLQWQRTFIELLQADIEVRLASALAWVDVRRVAGMPLASGGGGGK